VGDVLDWPALCARLREGEQAAAGPLRQLWQALPEAARQAVARAALRSEDQQEVVYGLNEFIKDPLPDPKMKALPDLPDDAPLRDLVAALPKDFRQWPDQDRRRFGRLFLEALCPQALRPLARRAGLEYILSYQTRGEFIGEIGLLTGRPRSATCVAYAHPDPGQGHQGGRPAKWRREEPVVELVRIPRALFARLRQESPALERKVQVEVAKRRERDVRLESAAPWDAGREVHLSRRFEELGLMQGQKLMLIDLDRCTRCDECVQACAHTHADGRSRLFLDGPRHGKYLVPATCRSCLDPVCLIGCPVGSIHRGDNREIVVESWCIGCGLCATNCPYGSVQMHDLGVIPEGTHGWTFSLSASGRRLPGRTPFRNDRDFRAALRRLGAQARDEEPWTGEVHFRYEFELTREALRSAPQLRMAVTGPNTPGSVRVNGREVEHDPKWGYKQGRREYLLSREAGLVRAGRNEVAVRVVPAGKELEVLLDLRLDEVHEPELPAGLAAAPGESLTVSEKLVKQVAVVCDLCSSQWGRRPACVTACPHDAAMRVNARFEFPED
jgi:Fe-S-cluster-containing hydrogenase component 2